MATVGTIRRVKSLNLELYRCQICLENMLDLNPRLLACHHSFCESCLRHMVKNNKISCPSCRKETKIPGGNVSKLTKDFRLLQVVDHVEKLTLNKEELCELCEETDPENRCQTCNKVMCDVCRDKHNTITLFKGHQVDKLCTKHPGNDIKYVCCKCVQLVCTSCVVTEHSDHDTQVEPYRVGIENLISYLDSQRIKLKHIMTPLSNYKRIIGDYTKLFEKLLKLESDVLLGNIKCYNSVMKEVKDKLELGEQILNEQDSESTDDEAYENLENSLKKPKHILELKKSKNWDLQVPVGIAFENKKSIFIADQGLSRVSRLNTHGKVISTIKADIKHGKVINVRTVIGEYLYVGQEKCISKYMLTDQDEVITEYCPGIIGEYCQGVIVIGIDDFEVVSDKLMIIIGQDRGVYEYDTIKNITKLIFSEEDEDSQMFISCVHSDHPARYIITFSCLRRIDVYDKDWNLLSTFVDDYNTLSHPTSTVALPDGFLVADTGNDTISYFNMDAVFQQHLLNEDDGILSPWRLGYIEGHLWVTQFDTESGDCNVNCYK